MFVLRRPSNSAVNGVPSQSCTERSERATEGEVFLPKKPVTKQPIYEKAIRKILPLQS